MFSKPIAILAVYDADDYQIQISKHDNVDQAEAAFLEMFSDQRDETWEDACLHENTDYDPDCDCDACINTREAIEHGPSDEWIRDYLRDSMSLTYKVEAFIA